MKTIAILGSTGSIGCQTLDIVRRQPDRLRIGALAAGSDVHELCNQALAFAADAVGLFVPDEDGIFDTLLPNKTVVSRHFGAEGLEEIATLPSIDIVVMAVAGSVGIRATIAALMAGKTVAIATKEVLVAAGELVVEAAKLGGGKLIPVDSEHSAIFQCLNGFDVSLVKALWLTASGGPFRGWLAEQLATVTSAQALNHPTWNMGPKVTVDSATLMNKGLETIEAKWLFNLDINKIDVVIHPQSVIHSMVEMIDGAVLAQLGVPDMRLPISYALMYPERVDLGDDVGKLDVRKMSSLTFESPNLDLFPCLGLARDASTRGGTSPAVMNAANEAAVDLFLRDQMGFNDIPRLVYDALEENETRFGGWPNLDQILEADQWAREFVTESTMGKVFSQRKVLDRASDND